MLDDAGRERITEAVRAAEARSAVEIMPVVAAASGRYDRAEDLVGLWCAGTAVVVAAYLLPADEPGAWGGVQGWQPWILLAALLLAFIAGAALASRVFWLRRLFAPAAQQKDEVAQRAQACFFDSRTHHTAGASGLLIYVSLGEHRAVLLGDRAVVEAVGQERIEEWCRALTADIRRSGLSEAICASIARAGEELAAKLPRQEDDVNELDDAVVELPAP